jgi:hypothetical protein
MTLEQPDTPSTSGGHATRSRGPTSPSAGNVADVERPLTIAFREPPIEGEGGAHVVDLHAEHVLFSLTDTWTALETAAWRLIAARRGVPDASEAEFEAALEEVMQQAVQTLALDDCRATAHHLRLIGRVLRASRWSDRSDVDD